MVWSWRKPGNLGKLFLAAPFDASSPLVKWVGSQYDSMNVSISSRTHLSPDTEVFLPKDISDNSWLIFPISRDFKSLVRSLQMRGGNQATTSYVMNTHNPLGCSAVCPLIQVAVSYESISHLSPNDVSSDPY